MNNDAGGSSASTTADYGGQSFNSGPYLTAAGGILSAYGQIRAGRLSKKLAQFNAEYARIQAAQAIQAGKYAQTQVEGRTRLAEGEARAAQAAGGTVVGAGTNRAVLDSIEGASEMDKLLIEINARRQAYGFQVQAADQTMRGAMAQAEGEQGAISTLLDTGARLELQQDESYGGYRRRRQG